jgi:uncharacterized GH25 family protein
MNAIDPTIPFGHKIRPQQRDRLAIVYIRQSTSHQVVSNRESADLQYQLRQRRMPTSWPITSNWDSGFTRDREKAN